jgi:hypothetical protein
VSGIFVLPPKKKNPDFQNNVGLQSTVKPFSNRAELIKTAALIAWDELPAANVAWMDCVDELCRYLKKRDLPFGGIPFVGIGDFRQVAPVVKGCGSTSSLLASIKSSIVWSSFHVHDLRTPIRSAQDPEYTTSVDRIGEDYRSKRVVIDLLARVENIDASVQFLFPAIVLENPLASLKRAFLSPLNTHVDEFNEQVLRRLPEQERPFFSSSSRLLPENFSQNYITALMS